MMNVDWNLFAMGLAAGTVAAALFFALLGWGMHLSLRRARPVAVLLPSSVLRIALLLIAGWWVATLGAAAAIGFALAFFTFRLILVALLRPAKGGA
jgi:hypothetical protein